MDISALCFSKEVGPYLGRVVVGIACSGGADSMFLLHALKNSFPARDLLVLHFNHKQRGESSDDDANFVAAVSAQMGLKCVIGEWENAIPHASEGRLRAARLAFFAQQPVEVICFGHQLEDIAETLLMRLTRGSGSEGLSAPRPISRVGQQTFLRPLLNISRSNIRAALHEHGIAWREDSSNDNEDYFRNRIRKQILPILAEQADPLRGMARSRMLLEEDNTAVDFWLNSIVNVNNSQLDCTPLIGLPKALFRRALNRHLRSEPHALELDSNAVDLLLEHMYQQQTFQLNIGQHTFLVYEDHVLQVREKKVFNFPVLAVPQNTALYWPDGSHIFIESTPLTADLRTRLSSKTLNNTIEIYCKPQDILARTWVDGDAYKPIGMHGHKKVQDLFTDRKISKWVRHSLPVFCSSDGQILWIPGLPPADDSKLSLQDTAALHLVWSR
ncbi:MAG: tRNA lysidine(34) synthetase TilS [Verrucomicrobia bacterium GWF2_51_19]|nr:MAG: tRNA lysidine(34) synthetase TilS [Verrucomicrobia bacterium GWF2_51_19]